MDPASTPWQTAPNSCWFIEEVLYCDSCNKKHTKVLEILSNSKERIGTFCITCMMNLIHKWMQKDECIYIRSLETFVIPKGKREPIGLALRYKVMKRDGFACVACGRTARDLPLEVDHKTPVAAGGKSTMTNLQTLCFECNRGKRDG